MNIRVLTIAWWVTGIWLLSVSTGVCQQNSTAKTGGGEKKLTLGKAAVCEEIREFAPFRQAVAFSISVGKVSCYSMFDPVPQRTFIYHSWFHRDKLSTKKKLRLKAPRWATFSTIQLRQSDKGPWRVVISDLKGRVFQVLRFSVTD